MQFLLRIPFYWTLEDVLCVLVNSALKKLGLGIIPLDPFNSSCRFDRLPNPLREDKGKRDVLITNLEKFFSYPKLLPLPSSTGLLDEDTNFPDCANIYIIMGALINNSWIWCICFLNLLNIYSIRKQINWITFLLI